MDQRLDEILATADWKELTPRLLDYGDSLIRNCRWRGIPVTSAPGEKLCVDGRGADDFVQLALERFLNGKRKYERSVSLEQNLRGAIRSLIWSANKSCWRSRITELPDTDDSLDDRTDQFQGSTPTPDEALAAHEQLERERRTLNEFERSLADDPELQQLVAAYKAGRFKPREVETYTGIPAIRVSDLKRKLKNRARKFEALGYRHENECHAG